MDIPHQILSHCIMPMLLMFAFYQFGWGRGYKAGRASTLPQVPRMENPPPPPPKPTPEQIAKARLDKIEASYLDMANCHSMD